jgi:hypothetical protein
MRGVVVEEDRRWVDWTDEEKAVLIDVWSRPEGLKRNLHLFSGRSIDSLKHKARSMGLPPRSTGPANRGGPNEVLILKLLELRPMDITEVAVKLGIWERPARFRLKALHAAGKVHIDRYERFSPHGPAARMWALGPGVDAPRPKPIPQAQRQRELLHRMRREDPFAYERLLARKRLMELIRSGRLVKRDPAAAALFGGARSEKASNSVRAQMEAV